jgi:long-chain fatty acid transport protein
VKALNLSLLVLALVLTISLNGFAGGFQVNEHGARATAMGGAVFANLTDASAIYFNPGALSYIPGTSIVFGTTLIFPSSKFTGPVPLTTETETESAFFYPSVLYASHSLESGLSFGLGIFNPYGLGTEWDENWVGRALGIKSTLRTFFFNPTVAYRVSDNLGIGAGFNYVYGTVLLTQAVPLDQFGIPAEGKVDFDGTGNGMGWNVGIYFTATEQLTLGLSYRSSIDLDFDGDSEFDVPAPLAPLLPGGDVTTSVSLPANLYAGISYQVNDQLNLNLGYQHIFWSVVEHIEIDFATKTRVPGTEIPVQDKQALLLNYDDGFIFRLGAEYVVNENLAVRGGYLFDSNPTPDEYMTPRLPDSDRHGISLGFGYRASDLLTVDFSYMFLQFVERTVETHYAGFNGTYNSSANLLGLNFKFML